MEVQPLDLDHVIGVLERPVDVAVVIDPVPGHVGADLLVQDRARRGRPPRPCRPRTGSGLVLDVDQPGGVAGQLARLGQHHRHRVALVAHLVDGQRPLLELPGRLGRDLEERHLAHLLGLFAGQHRVHAVQRSARLTSTETIRAWPWGERTKWA